MDDSFTLDFIYIKKREKQLTREINLRFFQALDRLWIRFLDLSNYIISKKGWYFIFVHNKARHNTIGERMTFIPIAWHSHL